MYHKLLSLGIIAGIFIPNVVLAKQVTVRQESANATAAGDRNHVVRIVHQSST